jgi:hypothetical protein
MFHLLFIRTNIVIEFWDVKLERKYIRIEFTIYLSIMGENYI